jgi:hypothetical protein
VIPSTQVEYFVVVEAPYVERWKTAIEKIN